MRLVLVRHAMVTIRDCVPTPDWHLSPEGRSNAELLASSSVFDGVDLVVSSTEPKAIGTAQRIAWPKQMRLRIEPDLREVERPLIGEAGLYRQLAQRYLRGEALDGWEEQALVRERMRGAVERLSLKQDAALVSHGLALTLLLAETLRMAEEESTKLWSDMRFPDTAVLDWPSGAIRIAFGAGSPEIHA